MNHLNRIERVMAPHSFHFDQHYQLWLVTWRKLRQIKREIECPGPVYANLSAVLAYVGSVPAKATRTVTVSYKGL